MSEVEAQAAPAAVEVEEDSQASPREAAAEEQCAEAAAVPAADEGAVADATASSDAPVKAEVSPVKAGALQDAAAQQPEAQEAEEEANPLVMDSSLSAKSVTKTKKKKKKAATAMSPPPSNDSPAMELITARLAELDKKKATKEEDNVEAPHAMGLRLLAEGGDTYLREAYQKSIQLAKKLEREITLTKRRCDKLQKEKERTHISTADIKAAQQHAQLRCHEIQKQVKALKEAADKMEAEKGAQRKELEQKFQSAIDEISSKLQEGNNERDALRKENEDLEVKVKTIEEECNQRFEKYQELHAERSGELEEKKKVEAAVEGHSLEERQNSQRVEDELRGVLRSVADLTMQIKLYSERMGDFEASITKSKDVFGTFGKEIQRMKDHAGTLTTSRDEAKEELAAISKRVLALNEERQRLRRQIEAQTRGNTKVKESAQKLTTRRAQWKPYGPYVAAWKESLREDDEETADTTASQTDPAKGTEAQEASGQAAAKAE